MATETSNPAAMEQGQLPFMRSFQVEEPVSSWSSKQNGSENKEGSFSEVTEQALVQRVAPVDPLACEHVPTPEKGLAYYCKQFREWLEHFCKQLGMRVWQLVLYAAVVALSNRDGCRQARARR